MEVVKTPGIQRCETTDDSIVEMLEKTPLWSGLTKLDLRQVIKASKERSFESGHTVVSKGDPGDGFYLIFEGAAEVRSDGKTLSKLGPGQFFGEMSILDNQPRSADVVTVEPSRILFLSALSFKTLIFANPKIALKMLQEFVRRLRDTDKLLSE
ncbi:MAG TPA: cyclic nucleotide-binding domain-containing protein [Candidatus Acidoferrum sp.]|nr:cyclic nucleotide-binding domain-containing protein [Candidatus Acidoferrum sp.]